MNCKRAGARAYLAAALVFTAGQTARAEQPAEPSPIEKIIVTGVRTNDFGARSGIPIQKMPQSVQVIENEELNESGVRSVEEALRVVPSVTAAGSRIGTGTSNTLRVRGFAGQVMRNGMRQRFLEGVDSSSMSNIARIEVLKGPSGVLYGQSGVGGIVSLITKQPTDAFEASVALTGGSFDQRMATFDVSAPVDDGFGVRLTGEIERSGTFVDFMDLDRENVALTFAWQPADWISAHLVAEYADRRTVNNPGLPTVGTVISNGVATVDRSTFLGEPGFNLQTNHAPLIQTWVDLKLSDDWTLTPRFQYSEFNNRSASTTLLPPVIGFPTVIERVGRNAGEEDRFYVAQADLVGHAGLFGVDHELLFGVEYSDEAVNFRMQDNVPCGIGPIDALNPVYGCGAPTSNFGFLSVAAIEGVAFYAQDQITLTDAWNVIVGIRHSEFTNDNDFITAFFTSSNTGDLSNTTWQLGSTYDLGGGVSLFGGYNTGYDLEWVIGARKADGSPFQPETSDQAEAGIRFLRDTFRASASAFRIRRNNVAVPDPANLGFQIQEGQFTLRGVELEGEWSPVPGWRLQGGYAYLNGEMTETTDPAMVDAQLAETPEHSATLTSRLQLGDFEVRASGRYVGERLMINGGSVVLPDYAVFDLGVATDIGPVRIDAALTNVFDETYYYSDNLFVFSIGTEDRVLPGDPRAFSLRARYRFGGDDAQ